MATNDDDGDDVDDADGANDDDDADDDNDDDGDDSDGDGDGGDGGDDAGADADNDDDDDGQGRECYPLKPAVRRLGRQDRPRNHNNHPEPPLSLWRACLRGQQQARQQARRLRWTR